MRNPGLCRLTFTLPGQLDLLQRTRRYQPCLAGCVVHIEPSGLVTIEGPSRECVFDQARRFMLDTNKRKPAEIAAWLRQGEGAVRDQYKIIVGAEVAITPASALPSTLYPPESGPAAAAG